MAFNTKTFESQPYFDAGSFIANPGDIPRTKQVLIPQESNDNPFDVTLVIADGREFKAHRRALLEASPFSV